MAVERAQVERSLVTHRRQLYKACFFPFSDGLIGAECYRTTLRARVPNTLTRFNKRSENNDCGGVHGGLQ